VKGVFLADESVEGLRCFGIHQQKTLLVIKNVCSRFGDLGNRREISSQFHMEEGEAGIWSSKAMLRPKHIARTL
jgi:hypothetical protein